MTTLVRIPYTPRSYFQELHTRAERWKVIVANRRSGKTVAAINHLQRDAMKIPDSRFAYIAPYRNQAKNIAWDLLKRYSYMIPGIEYNETELLVKYPSGARISLYGADNAVALRGIGLWGVIFDEYAQQPGNIFTEIIRPALTDHKGYAIWIGTPSGKDEFYRLYAGLDNEGNTRTDLKDWYRVLLTVDDTKSITPEELESARATMSHDEFQQEFYCSFQAAIKGAYYADELALARKESRIKHVAHDPLLRVHTVWDLGVGEALVVGFVQRISTEVRLIDVWQGKGNDGIIDALQAIQKKKYILGKCFFPHDGWAREESTGKMRVDSARNLGFEVIPVPNIPVDDGIEIARTMWPRLWIDEKNAALFIDKIAQYRREWDDKKDMFKMKPRHDHASHWGDLLRYIALTEDKMTNTVAKVLTDEERNALTNVY